MPMNWKTLLCSERPRRSTSSGDHRTQFERDLDRTVFSTPVKRLQDKAQVFPLEPHDAVRMRLTHSLEVSSVSRGLAIAVGKWLLDKSIIEPGMERSIEAIAATCGLIHDLGNPPFGHSGEDAIRLWFQKDYTEERLCRDLRDDPQLVQDFQQVRGQCSIPSPDDQIPDTGGFPWLESDFWNLVSVVQVHRPSHGVCANGDHAKSKPGYFASENDIVEQIRERTGTGNSRRNPITYLVEAADDIVYSVADVEDAVKKGVLAWSEVDAYLKGERDQIIEQCACRCDTYSQGR